MYDLGLCAAAAENFEFRRWTGEAPTVHDAIEEAEREHQGFKVYAGFGTPSD